MNIAPRDRSAVAFDQGQNLINHVWTDLGYKFPPQIARLSKTATRVAAHANRHTITIPEMTSTWILLHEMAHSLTMLPSHLAFNDEHAGHDDSFVGAYFHLCERFLGIPQMMLWALAQKEGLQYKVFTKAAFED